MRERLNIVTYAMRIAEAAASRSEDPHCAVGAVALTRDNRIIGTAYNGLAPGRSLTETQWQDRDYRRQYVIHAEQNLCSLFRRGEVHWACLTLSPCLMCLKLLSAHDVQLVVYRDMYELDSLPRNEVLQVLRIRAVHVSEAEAMVREIGTLCP